MSMLGRMNASFSINKFRCGLYVIKMSRLCSVKNNDDDLVIFFSNFAVYDAYPSICQHHRVLSLILQGSAKNILWHMVILIV